MHSVESSDTPLWQTQGVSTLYAQQAFSTFNDRGDVALSVNGGNIDNYLGGSLGLMPTSNGDAEQMLAQGQSVYENNAIIAPIAEEIRDLQGSVFNDQPVAISHHSDFVLERRVRPCAASGVSCGGQWELPALSTT